MKFRSVSRNLVPVVLVLFLAAVGAPAAAALPAGPAGSGAPHWDAASAFGWLHSMVGQLLGGGPGEETDPTRTYDEAKMTADPDGQSLTAEPSDDFELDRPTPGSEAMPR